LNFDLSASLRRRKPQRATTLLRRNDEALPFAPLSPESGTDLLLDSTVYVDVAQGRLPAHVKRLLERCLSNHSSVVLAELTHLFGRLDPSHPQTASNLAHLRFVISAIPTHRLSVPSPRAFAEAGMLAGLAARLTGAPHTPALLNDALLWLQAAENGWVLLTRNVRDFDVLQQLAPEGRALLYRRV
jgi:predicted nucleic acid-binding protein